MNIFFVLGTEHYIKEHRVYVIKKLKGASGPVIKNLLASAGDMGFFALSWKILHAVRQLGPHHNH